ncbi:MAG: ribosome assembly RNA-binding protein YhbY [Sarcina sp.]
MITTKQRSFLRGMANRLDPIFQVGKNGIEDNFLKQVTDALEKRELIKIKVLENSGITAREASDIICEEIGCEGIQAIGSKLVLYKQSSKKPVIELPVAKRK